MILGAHPARADGVHDAAFVVKSGFARRFAVAYDPVLEYGLYAKYSNFVTLGSKLESAFFEYSIVSPQNFTLRTYEVFGL